jgi:RNA polymerase sigma-70 factor (ECF subfamily)
LSVLSNRAHIEEMIPPQRIISFSRTCSSPTRIAAPKRLINPRRSGNAASRVRGSGTIHENNRLASLSRPFHDWALERFGAKMELGVVNLRRMGTSTKSMAAGIAVKPMTAEAAQEIAAREFAGIVESHRPQIFRFLLASLRDVDLAETLTQECFLKAHRNWGSFRGESSAMTWLMRIAINLQKDHWRNRRMQFWRQTRTNAIDLDEASEWLPSGESSVEQRLLAQEQVKHVWQSVKGLSERQRTVFLLRYVEERELSEIARATGLSEGTVKAHLSRAVSRVRAELGGKR